MTVTRSRNYSSIKDRFNEQLRCNYADHRPILFQSFYQHSSSAYRPSTLEFILRALSHLIVMGTVETLEFDEKPIN
eukprot:6191756-Pleurochrysis_carterae.AAC.2